MSSIVIAVSRGVNSIYTRGPVEVEQGLTDQVEKSQPEHKTPIAFIYYQGGHDVTISGLAGDTFKIVVGA